jgi:hypothetical protein
MPALISSFVISTILLLIAIVGTPARADQFYFCSDGRMAVVDQQNWAAMQDHPCVKEWRAKNAAPEPMVVKHELNGENSARRRRMIPAASRASLAPVALPVRAVHLTSFHF